jgi:hypothetical protein
MVTGLLAIVPVALPLTAGSCAPSTFALWSLGTKDGEGVAVSDELPFPLGVGPGASSVQAASVAIAAMATAARATRERPVAAGVPVLITAPPCR